jgi:hypothetical protein
MNIILFSPLRFFSIQAARELRTMTFQYTINFKPIFININSCAEEYTHTQIYQCSACVSVFINGITKYVRNRPLHTLSGKDS